MTRNASLNTLVLTLVIILLGLDPLLVDSAVFAQEAPASKPIQYRRVFVPSENLPLLGSDFVPVNVNELEQLLKSHREQAKPPLDHTTPTLFESLYVASLVEQDLVSSASRISISCQSETPRFYTFTPCSLSIQPTTVSLQMLADSLREGLALESQPFRYDLQGLPTIAVKQSTDFWFGWTLHGESEHDLSRLKFKLDVPPCMDSRLLLQLPPMWRVESETSVVRLCEDPIPLLGPTWPYNFDVDREPASENWWLVELSGSSSVAFDLVQSVEAFQLNFDRMVSRARIDYRLLPGSLEVVSEFQLSDSIDSLAGLTIRMDPGMHISSVTLDEVPLDWRPGRLPFCIDILNADELEDQQTSTRRRLIVRGLATWPLLDGQKKLPTIQLEKAFSIDGVGSVAIHQDWVVNQVKIDNGHVFSRSGTTQLGGLGRFDFEWVGGPPMIQLEATPRSQQGRAEALTRLSNDSDGLVATTWVNISANSNPRSSVKFALSEGWVIESVQSTERRFLTTWYPIPNSDNSEWQVHIAPAVENQAMTLEIRSRNTALTGADNANPTTLVFDGNRPIAFRDLKQTDIYWIEPTGRYKMDANPELLQCQIDLQQITESQRQRLPRIGEVWLIKPDGNKIPRLTFRRQSAPYTAQLETTIEPSMLGVSAKYRLKCVPLAGAVSSVTIDVQHSGNDPIRWRQHKNTTDSNAQWIPVESVNVRRDDRKTPKSAKNSAAAAFVRIILPNAMSEEFELEGNADFPSPSIDAVDTITTHIPLLSLPEAAQKDATLQVDERLTLVSSDKIDPWTPLGYVPIRPDTEAYRFRYDPIQLTAVDIQPRQPSQLPDVWLADVVLRHRHYLDGQNECDLQARLHANEASAVNVNIPSGWRLRKAMLDGRVIDAIDTSNVASRVQIWIPRQTSRLPSSDLSLIFDGPQSVIRHREQIDLPAIEPSCPVLNQRYELWLPPALTVQLHTSELKLAFPSLELSKLLPSRWYRRLWPNNASDSTVYRSFDDGSHVVESATDTSQLALSWSTEWVDAIRTNHTPLTVLVSESERAEDWSIVFSGFAISLCLAHLRKTYLAITGLILVFGILATNGRALEAIQLASLGWIVSCVLLVINACIKPREKPTDRSFFSLGGQVSRSQVSAQFNSKSFGWAIAIFLGFNATPHVMAQSQPEKVYHVVLPVDSNDEFSSEVAYVSEDLLQELYRHKKAQDRVTQFLSARYALRLVDSDLRNTVSTAFLTLRYEIDVRDLRQPIRFPLQVEQASFVALLVDGSEIPLGSRLRWDEHVLHWTPPSRGLTQIELTIAATLKRDTVGRFVMEVDIVPFAGAQLDIETMEMIDVQCNAMGQVLNPTSGHLQVALGPRNKLNASWRRPERDIRVATPTAVIESEFALLGDTILARTNIEISETTTRSDRFDIECDSGWQPLGRRWGAATLLDSLSASSRTRRRYRLKWDDEERENPNSGSVVIHWVANNSRTTLMNLPEIELPGARIQENIVRFIRRKDSAWTFEGLQSWTKADLESRFEWLPRATREIIAYRKPPNAPSAFLRRMTTSEKRSATMESHLRFLTNEVHCKTTVTLNHKENHSPDIRFTLPTGVEVQTVLANQIEVPFSIFRVDDSQVQLQVFLDPDSEALDTIIIESMQPYADFSWLPLPLPSLDQYLVKEHRVSATRVVSQWIEWEGIDALVQTTQSPSAPIAPGKNEQNFEVSAWGTRFAVVTPENRDDSPLLDGSKKHSKENSLRYRTLQSRESNPGYVVSQLTRNDERWNFQVHGFIEAGASPIDGVLMDVPHSMLESLQCSHRITQFESPDASRQLVYVFSDEPLSNKSFEFELKSSLPPTESNSTTELPEIRMLGDNEWQQWLIVPRSIANQEARWSLSGARTVDASSVPDFAKTHFPDFAKNFLVVVPTTDRPNVRLSNVAANPMPITLSLVTHEVAMDADQLQNASSSFFFIPRGQLKIPVRIPPGRKLLAVECSGHKVPRSSINVRPQDLDSAKEDESLLSIRLFSSSMPQKITLHTCKLSDASRMGLEMKSLPEIVDASAERTLIILDSPEGVVGYGAQSLDNDRSRELLAKTVLSIVEQASGFIAEASLTERLQWWQDWQESTSSIWKGATLLEANDFPKALSERRQILFDRLQLPVQAQPQQATFLSVRPSKDVRQYFLIDSEINSTLDLRIRSFVPKHSNWIDSKVWFGWSIWFVSAIFAIRFTYLHFDPWITPLKQYILNRPWWLFGALGSLSFALAPNLWYGPGFLLIALYYVFRTYSHEISRTHD